MGQNRYQTSYLCFPHWGSLRWGLWTEKRWRMGVKAVRSDTKVTITAIACIHVRVGDVIHNQLSTMLCVPGIFSGNSGEIPILIFEAVFVVTTLIWWHFDIYEKVVSVVLQMHVDTVVLQGRRFRELFRNCDHNNMITCITIQYCSYTTYTKGYALCISTMHINVLNVHH